MRTFAERLKATREEKTPELSQMDLAKLSGVSQTTISNIESGRNNGSKFTIKLAAALGVRPQWLEDETGPKSDDGEEAAAPAHTERESDPVPAPLRKILSAYKNGSQAKQEALARLADLPEQEMGTLLLVIQSIGSKYKK